MHAHITAHIQHDMFSNKFYHQNNESTICVCSNESTKHQIVYRPIVKITDKCIGRQELLDVVQK